MKRRVVVTGMGAVTPIGNTVDEFWKGIRAGVVGIGEITKFDTTDYKVKLAAEVKNFDVKERLDFKAARRMDTFSQFAVAAGKEAFEQSGLCMEKEDPFRVGVIVGSGIGSLQEAEKACDRIREKGPAKVNPLMVPLMISNMAAGNLAIQLGLKGKCTAVTTACATGTHAIGDAFRAIQYGDADVMLAGGTESAICPTAVAGFTALTALTTAADAKRASIPFDKDRSGFVIGEVAGYGATCDAYHITSPAEDGSGAAKAMELAMKEAGILPGDVDYINAHGTSTHHNDLFETRAIESAFGEAARKPVINSTKSMIGHLLGAAGAVELITCIKTIEEGWIHPIMGTQELDEKCTLNYALHTPVEREVNRAISNSLGFGGHNATLAVKKYMEGSE